MSPVIPPFSAFLMLLGLIRRRGVWRQRCHFLKSNLLGPFNRSPPTFQGSEIGLGALTFCGGSGPDTQHTRCDKSIWKQDTQVIIYCQRPPVQPRGHLESSWLVPSVSCSWKTVSRIPQLMPEGFALPPPGAGSSCSHIFWIGSTTARQI